jgi:hypothetical protein
MGSYNTELLNRIFDSAAIAEEYRRLGGLFIPGNAGIQWWINDFREGVGQKITRLEAILDRLDLIPTSSEGPSPEALAERPPAPGREVFVVHGHDEAAKEAVARFLERLDLRPESFTNNRTGRGRSSKNLRPTRK